MPHLLQVLLGLVLIVGAGLYPLWAVSRLNRRLGRPNGPSPLGLALWLAFTLSFPFALALTGTALIAAPLAHSLIYRAVVGGLWSTSVLVGILRLWKE